MKIAGFTTRLVSLPRETSPLGEGPGSITISFVTLKMWTDDGVEGIGYAGFVSGVMQRALKEAVDGLAELAVGDDPMMVEAISSKLLAAGGGGAPAGLVTRAAAAIDVALWDIKGKALRQPVYKLLGGYRDRVPTYASGKLWRTYDLEALAESAAELVGQGFRAMKFRLGAEDSVAKEVARLRVMRKAVGDDVDLMVDINQGWDVNQAINIGRSFAEYDIFWLEDPVHH